MRIKENEAQGGYVTWQVWAAKVGIQPQRCLPDNSISHTLLTCVTMAMCVVLQYQVLKTTVCFTSEFVIFKRTPHTVCLLLLWES